MRNWSLTVGRLLMLVVMTTVLFSPRGARGADNPTEAKRRFVEGSAAYNRGDFKEAIDLFKAAHRLKPAPELLFNIAQSYRKLKDYDNALFFYRAYLRQSGNGSNRAEAEKQAAEMSRLLEQDHASGAARSATAGAAPPAASPADVTQPSGTKPQADGRPTGAGPNPSAAVSQPPPPPTAGTTAVGRDSRSIAPDQAGGAPTVPVAPAGPAAAAARTPESSSPPPGRSSRPMIGWIVGSVGVASLAVGVIEVLAGLSNFDAAVGQAKSANAAGDMGEYQKASETLSTGRSQRNTGAVLMAVGAVAVAGGLVLVFGPRSHEGETALARLSPWLEPAKGSPTSGGLAWSARW